MHPLPLLSCLAVAPLLAQVPTDAVLVLETTTQVTAPAFVLVDALGRGTTGLRNQNVFMPFAAVATDPVSAGRYFCVGAGASLAGTWQTLLGPLAAIGTSQWGSWQRSAAARLAVGATQVFTLQAGVVEAVAKTGGNAVPLLTVANAVDLAVADPYLYVVAGDPFLPAPVVEYDLRNGAQRVVANVVGATSLAVAGPTSELMVGTQAGDLLRLAIATGQTNATLPLGIGPVRLLAATRFGTAVYSDGQSLWSELAPGAPLFTSATGILDLDVGTALGPSIVPFGRGCGPAASCQWASGGLPTLGNAGFRLGLRDGPANGFAVLALGASRTAAPAIPAALPYDLQPFGAPGCLLLADPQATALRVLGATGATDQPLPLPNSPALSGVEFAGQWFVPAPGANALGLATTEGVAFVLR